MSKIMDIFKSPIFDFQKFFRGVIRIYRFAWKEFSGSTILLLVLTVVGTIFSYMNRAFLGLLLNKLIDTVAGKNTGGISLSILLIVLLISLIIPRLTSAFSQYINVKFSRHFQHFYETAVHKKTVALDFASHDSPKRNDLFQQVRDNMWRISNFYLRPIWLLDSMIWVIATLITLIAVNPWF